MARRSSGGGGGRSSYSYRPAAKSSPRKPAAPRAAPAAPAPSMRGGFIEAVGDGIGFGAGRAVGDRVADAVLGPRTIQHKPAPAAAADVCPLQTRAFQDCLYSYMTDISQCQIYMDTWAACRRSHSSL